MIIARELVTPAVPRSVGVPTGCGSLAHAQNIPLLTLTTFDTFLDGGAFEATSKLHARIQTRSGYA